MTAPSVSTLIQRVRELDAKTTKGPWVTQVNPSTTYIKQAETRHFVMEPRPYGVREPDDADFIAEARTLLPQLADACARMQQERDDIAKHRDSLQKQYDHFVPRVAELEGQIAEMRGFIGVRAERSDSSYRIMEEFERIFFPAAPSRPDTENTK